MKKRNLKEYTIGVVGAGSMANRRIQHLKDLISSRIVCYDIREDRREEVAKKYGIETVGSVSSLINKNPYAIFISVPPASHEFYIELALEHNWHFMTEQPITHNFNVLEDLSKNVKIANLITHVSNNMRFHPSIKKIKNLAREEAVGPILSGMVEIGEWLPDWHSYEPYTDYYPSHKRMGGGLDAICDISWICDIFKTVSRISCFAAKKTTLDIDTDDLVQILIDFNNGPQIHLHSDMIQRPNSHKAKFIGEKGVIEWSFNEPRVKLYDAIKKKWEIFEDEVDYDNTESMKGKKGWEWVEHMYLEDTRFFIEKLINNDKSMDSLEEGIYYLKLTLDALDCSKLNKICVYNK